MDRDLHCHANCIANGEGGGGTCSVSRGLGCPALLGQTFPGHCNVEAGESTAHGPLKLMTPIQTAPISVVFDQTDTVQADPKQIFTVQTIPKRFSVSMFSGWTVRSRWSWIGSVGLLCGLLMFVGCDSEPQIVQYEVDTTPPTELSPEKRMLGAIVPSGDAVWFFKLMGDSDAVEPVRESVRDFVRSVEFSDGEPRFVLPVDWVERPGNRMRFATLEIPSEPLPLELTISRLGRSSDWDELVRANVNRWRGQVGLEDSDAQYAGGELLGALDEDANTPAIWVDVQGTPAGDGSGSMMPPMMSGGAGASGGAGMSAGAPVAPPAAPQQDVEVAYEVPEGWTEGPAGGMRKASFSVGSGADVAELTVIPSGGGLRSNIERWLGQIRPEGVDAAVLDTVMESARDLQVDGRAAQRFVLEGTAASPQAIDGTVIPLEDGRSLFIKMTGPAAVVLAEADRITAFLASLEIKNL